MESNQAKVDVYEQINNAIVSAVEEGTGRYEMPWHALSTPLNATNRKPYRGVNVLMLWATAQKNAYTSNEWATYRQWQKAGAQVRKGERSTTVVFWKFYDRPEEQQEIQTAPKNAPVALHGATTYSMPARSTATCQRFRSNCRRRCEFKTRIAFLKPSCPRQARRRSRILFPNGRFHPNAAVHPVQISRRVCVHDVS